MSKDSEERSQSVSFLRNSEGKEEGGLSHKNNVNHNNVVAIRTRTMITTTTATTTAATTTTTTNFGSF